jgi:hypothetical protein
LRSIEPSGEASKVLAYAVARQTIVGISVSGGVVPEAFVNSRRFVSTLAIVLALLLGAFARPSVAMTYDISRTVGTGTVVGTIQTDGVIGTPLTSGDVTGWNLTLTIGALTTNLTNLNSGLTLAGSDLTATLTGLFFNFSGNDGGYVLFQAPPGLNGKDYYCDAASSSPCIQGESVVPGMYPDPAGFQNAPMSGNQIIAAAETPLPKAWTMMLIGLFAVGLFAHGYVTCRVSRTAVVGTA